MFFKVFLITFFACTLAAPRPQIVIEPVKEGSDKGVMEYDNADESDPIVPENSEGFPTLTNPSPSESSTDATTDKKKTPDALDHGVAAISEQVLETGGKVNEGIRSVGAAVKNGASAVVSVVLSGPSAGVKLFKKVSNPDSKDTVEGSGADKKPDVLDHSVNAISEQVVETGNKVNDGIRSFGKAVKDSASAAASVLWSGPQAISKFAQKFSNKDEDSKGKGKGFFGGLFGGN